MRAARWRSVFSYSALALAAIFALFPIAWMLTVSLRPNGEIFTVPPRWLPPTPTLEAYAHLLGTSAYVRFFVNSYVVALAVTAVSLLLALPAGYSFSRFRYAGDRVLQLFIVGTQMVPPISLIIPYFLLIVSLGIYDSYPALIVTYASFCLPFATLMMASYFDSISADLEEAAMVDGCSRLGALWRVLVPLTIPGLVATGIYSFLLAWNEFLFAITLTQSESMRTVPVGIALLMGEHAFEWNLIMALSVLGSVPLFVIFVFLQRYLITGLTAGAVKG